MNNLGVMYEKGNGIEQNWQKAAEIYKMAAEKGDGKAQYNIGWCYYHGKGVNKNKVEAKKWLHKASDQGHEGAKEWIDAMIAEGDY